VAKLDRPEEVCLVTGKSQPKWLVALPALPV
jgi:hypothetical protein